MDFSEFSLRGEVAVVTGGGRGLGRHFALEAARWGAAVAVVGRTRESLDETVHDIAELGVECAAYVADVRDSAAPRAVIEAVESDLGPVSILVNNAGVAHQGLGPISSVPPEEFWSIMDINVRAPFMWTQAALTGMLARGHGRIINITSRAGRAAIPNAAAYCTSKAALSHMTAVLAVELQGTGVVTFAIAPLAATDGLHALTTAPGLSDNQHRIFQRLYSDGDKLLADSLALFQATLSGSIDHASGRHLDTTRPLTDQLDE